MTSIPLAKQGTQHIQRLSRTLATACLILIVALPIAVGIYWAVNDTDTLAVHANLPTAAIQGNLQAWQRITGAVLAEASLVLLLAGICQARQCFMQFTTGRIFTAEAVRCLKRFTGWTMASVLAEIVLTTVTSSILTLENPVHMRYLAIGFSSSHVLMLFFAGLVWLMADVISQGQMLAEENNAFI